MEVEGLKDEVSAYRNSLISKDAVLVQLTDDLFKAEAELKGKESSATDPPSSSPTVISPQNVPSAAATRLTHYENQDNQRLKDTVNGYKLQNQFLNNEIVELNRLKQEETNKLQQVVEMCIKLETCYYNEHRKHLACLKELGKTQNDDDPGSLRILENLLEDALVSRGRWSGKRSAVGKESGGVTWSEKKYDENGFQINPDVDYFADFSLDDKFQSVEKQSDALFHKAKSIEEGLKTNMSWERYMTNIGAGTNTQKSKELKLLIRAGVPNSYRASVWKWCIDFSTKSAKAGFRDNYYESLISTIKDSQLTINATARQVELDLLRTLPGNKYFEDLSSDKVQSLRRVLLAFSVHNPVVGYCQGLNRITGVALLFLEEEDAFWCLVTIVNHLLPANYFCAGMQGAHTDQRVLSELVQEKLPSLCRHFKELHVDMCVFTFNWFLTIYIDNIPPHVYLRIWDSFLYEGSKILFRYAVAFLKHAEDDLLKIDDSSQMHLYLRSLGHHMTDINRVSKIAFQEINHFPMKQIESKRQTHSVIVKAELDRMEEQRQSYRKKHQRPAESDRIEERSHHKKHQSPESNRMEEHNRHKKHQSPDSSTTDTDLISFEDSPEKGHL